MKKLYFGGKEWYFQVLFIVRGNNLTVGTTHQKFRWIIPFFFISDKTVLKQKKFQYNSRDVSVPYITNL